MYKEIVVDIETLDTEPTSCVLSLGAVKFNLDDEDDYDSFDDESRCFYSLLNVDEQLRDFKRTVSFSTTAWWVKQDKAAQNAAFAEKRRNVETVLWAFNEFCKGAKSLWGNGSNFDNTILRSLYADYGIPFPFRYWDDKDVRTLKYLAGDKKLNLPRGTKHHALEDAKYEALICQEYYKML